MTRLASISMASAAAFVTMLFTGLAHAETFSFTTTSETISQIIIPLPRGGVAAASWIKGSSTGVDSKGTDVSGTYVCSGRTNPPNDTFHLGTLCDVTGKGGDAFSIYAGCSFLNKERTESSCVGGLVGKAGTYKDRKGTITWHGKQTAEKTGTSIGAGVWNE